MENNKPIKNTYDSPRSYCKKAILELGLSTHSIEDTLIETGESYKKLGLL
tara:strand:- start:122 stop:271 length:150 start_codon:yes stop_codon:yes gene_type:complete